MLKKMISYTFVGVFVVAVSVGVYFFITKGYSGRGISISTAVPSAVPTGLSQATQGAATVTSDKISLIVTSPKDGDVLTSTDAVVKGKTTPGADVFVNDQSGKADANGNFSISVALDEGANLIVVLANDADGNVTQLDLNVTVTSFQ